MKGASGPKGGHLVLVPDAGGDLEGASGPEGGHLVLVPDAGGDLEGDICYIGTSLELIFMF